MTLIPPKREEETNIHSPSEAEMRARNGERVRSGMLVALSTVTGLLSSVEPTLPFSHHLGPKSLFDFSLSVGGKKEVATVHR